MVVFNFVRFFCERSELCVVVVVVVVVVTAAAAAADDDDDDDDDDDCDGDGGVAVVLLECGRCDLCATGICFDFCSRACPPPLLYTTPLNK